jgi:NAD(P)-dependent dehydrogenase (short-subunit alcohol dehydrogenase family)
MDLGIEGRTAALFGSGALADRCAAVLAAEGVAVRRDPTGTAGCDMLIEIASPPPDLKLAEIDCETASEAWYDLVEFAGRARAAMPGMQAKRWGRVIWVGPLAAKTMDQPEGDMERIVGLGMFGLLKAMSGELGRDAITCNSVLVGSDPSDFDGAAATVAFLASSPAAFVTGTVTAIDGGASKGIF